MKKRFALIGGVAGGILAAGVAAMAAFTLVTGIGFADGTISGRITETPQPVVVTVTTPTLTQDSVFTNLGIAVTNPNSVPVFLDAAEVEIVSQTPANCVIVQNDPSFQQLDPFQLAAGQTTTFYNGAYEVAPGGDTSAPNIPPCDYRLKVTVTAHTN